MSHNPEEPVLVIETWEPDSEDWRIVDLENEPNDPSRYYRYTHILTEKSLVRAPGQMLPPNWFEILSEGGN